MNRNRDYTERCIMVSGVAQSVSSAITHAVERYPTHVGGVSQETLA